MNLLDTGSAAGGLVRPKWLFRQRANSLAAIGKKLQRSCGLVRLECLLLFAALFVAGCSTKPEFQIKSDPAFTGKLESALVVYANQDIAKLLGGDFSERVAKRIADTLSSKGVRSDMVMVKIEDLDQDAPINAAVARFNPKHVIFFRVATYNEYYMGAPGAQKLRENVGLEFEIKDVVKGRTVWRGKEIFGWIPLPEEAADQFLQKLQSVEKGSPMVI